MSSPVAYYFVALVVIITQNMICPVRGQCTLQGCENGDSSNSIVADIQQMFVDAIRQQQNEQMKNQEEQDICIKHVQSIHELFNASFRQMKTPEEQDICVKHVQSIHELFNASFRQMKTPEEQDICIKQVQSINDLVNESFHEMKFQQDIVMTSLQAVDRRSQEQVQGMDNLNASLQEMKNQQEAVMTSLQAVDQRSQEKDIYIKQVQSINELVNASFQEMKNQQESVMTSLQEVDRRSQDQVQGIYEFLNASFQQMKTQHDAVLRSLEAFNQRLHEHDISIKNQTQNSWKLAVGVPVQLEIGIDLGQGPVLLPTIINNWIVLLHRFDGSLNFYRTWADYKNGFGDIGRGDFWLGNEIVHRLTNRIGIVYTLRIEVQLKTSARWFHADYATFSLDAESNKYTLRVSGFSGSAGDSLTNTSAASHWYQGGMKFTTSDADNDNSPNSNCAQLYQAGWWYNSCWFSCLTCRYDTKFAWESLKYLESGGLLRAARMMIRSK